MADIHVTAGCGCFLTSLGPAGIAVAMCKTHTARARTIFDRAPDQAPDQFDHLLAAVYTDQPTQQEAMPFPDAILAHLDPTREPS